MKILIISHGYYKYHNGGTEIQCKYIADYLTNLGYEVHYLFLHSENLYSKENNIYLHTLIREDNIYEKIFGELIYWFKVSKKLKKISPDIIYHRNLSNFALPVITYCKNNNCKSILHLAHINDVAGIKSLFRRNIISSLFGYIGKKRILKKFNYIIAQAEYQSKLLNKTYKREADLILPNVHPKPSGKKDKKETLQILWIANLKNWKKPEEFIRLAERCRSITDARFIMIGRDPQNEWSADLKEFINRTSNLEYKGELPIENVNQVLLESHIFINTSKYEGFPNTFIQAWMRKVPVVSLNVDPDDVLKINRIGFHSKSFERMVEDVKMLINNKSLREDIGNRSQKYAFVNHSIKNINKLIHLIENDTK